MDRRAGQWVACPVGSGQLRGQKPGGLRPGHGWLTKPPPDCWPLCARRPWFGPTTDSEFSIDAMDADLRGSDPPRLGVWDPVAATPGPSGSRAGTQHPHSLRQEHIRRLSAQKGFRIRTVPQSTQASALSLQPEQFPKWAPQDPRSVPSHSPAVLVNPHSGRPGPGCRVPGPEPPPPAQRAASDPTKLLLPLHPEGTLWGGVGTVCRECPHAGGLSHLAAPQPGPQIPQTEG